MIEEHPLDIILEESDVRFSVNITNICKRILARIYICSTSPSSHRPTSSPPISMASRVLFSSFISRRAPPILSHKHIPSIRRMSLVYTLHDPPALAKAEPSKTRAAPLIMLHGLFGSKQNYGSISKYVFSPSLHLNKLLLPVEKYGLMGTKRVLARDLKTSVYAVVRV